MLVKFTSGLMFDSTTHTPPALVAMLVGGLPTGIVRSVRSVRGSTRETV
jgi:hypothetical protein